MIDEKDRRAFDGESGRSLTLEKSEEKPHCARLGVEWRAGR